MLSPNQIHDFLVKNYFSARQPVIILGPPGVGKSETVIRAANTIASRLSLPFHRYSDDVEAEGFFFVDLRLYECDPSDLIGIPRSEDSYVTYKPLKWAKVLSMNPGILFLDEITNADDEVLKPAFKILLDRAAGFTRLDEKVMVVAAGNDPRHSSVARELPLPILNRCLVIDIQSPDVGDWVEYMHLNSIPVHPRVLAYLYTFKSHLLNIPEHAEAMENFPTPRSWTNLCKCLQMQLSEPELLAACIGFLGEEVGRKVYAFIIKNVPSIQEILHEPKRFKTLDLDVQYIFTVTLAQHLLQLQQIGDDVKLLLKVMLECMEEYAVVLFHAAGAQRFKLALRVANAVPEYRELFKKIRVLREGE